MAWHDQHERIFADRLRYRMRRAGGLQRGRHLAIAAGFAPGNGASEFVDPLVEGRYAVHVERDVGKTDRMAAQQRHQAFDRDLDGERGAHLARLRISLEQPPPGFDLARFGKLHAYHAGIAPYDAAPADAGVEYAIPMPHHATSTPAATIALPWRGASLQI